MAIGAVLPLCIRGSYDVDDLGRTEILFRSLTAFAEPGMFSTFLIVTPPDEVDIVNQRLEKWQHLNPVVISEEALIPELSKYAHVRGWRKQQLVKIAAAQYLKEDFYLTFDADVICLKPLTLDKLIVDGKALLQYESRELHPKWWKSSARMLKMSPDVGEAGVGMHITPSILAKDICLKLISELTELWGKHWVDEICSLHNAKDPRNWSIFRYLRSRWTEYSLYYMCAHKFGMFDNYHVVAGRGDNPQLLMIHDSHPYETWDVEKSFSDRCPGLFCVVGSKSFLEPEVVWQKVGPYVPEKSVHQG